MENVTWYYKESGQSKGPVSEEDLSALFSGGRLSPETLISEDCTNWVEAKAVATFSEAVAAAATALVRPPAEPLGKLERDEDVDLKNGPEVHPWVRFWARCIDGLLLTALGMPLFMAMVGGFGAVQLLMWVGVCLVFEAVTTSLLCATPGKWLLGISVRTVEGERLSMGQSLMRAGRVLLLGMGLGVPVINLVAMVLSYRRLVAEGWTLWDTFGPFAVRHKPVGVGRTSMGALVTASCLVFLLVVRPTAGVSAGPRGAMAQDPYAPKAASRPSTQASSQPTTRLLIQPSQRKMQPSTAPAKPTLNVKPSSKQGAKPAAKQPANKSAKPQAGGGKPLPVQPAKQGR